MPMPDERKKLLIIAYVFPPIAYAGTYRTLRLCKYLSRLGYQVHVLTIKAQKDLHNDPGLLDNIKDKVDVYRTETIDIWRFYNKFKKRFLKTKTGRVIDRILSFAVEILSQPDHMNLWIPFAVKAGIKIIKKHHLKIIYTTSPPHSQLISGYLLKKITGISWIADLRDPIQFNIASANWKRIEKTANFFLEKLTVRNADAIITNTKSALNDLKGKYKKNNIFHIPNSFDEDDFNKPINHKYSKFTISHIGTIYRFRNTEPLFQAISALNKAGAINPEGFVLKFVGLNDNLLKKTIAKYDLQPYVEIVSMVEHSQAIEIMKKSHMLLLIKGFDKNGLGQVPGKLYEYLGSGNPIMYIGPEESEASEIIADTDSGYIVGNDVFKIKDTIYNEFSFFRESGTRDRLSVAENAIFSRYASLEMANKFNRVFDALG
jgi:glycosyltransferase involved in cell wall biosynthesis